MMRITGEEPLRYEMIHVMYNGLCKTIVQHFEYTNRMMQFKDLLSEVDYKGGVIRVWADNPLNGELFEYGNYKDTYWYKVGETKGYA